MKTLKQVTKQQKTSNYTQHEGELLQFWTGNPQNDIWNGHVLLQKCESQQQINEISEPYLCCPAIPTHLHILEFCQFIEAYQRSISKVRVFQSPEPNQYMIALKFNGVNDARDFARSYQQRKFNQIEPEYCVVYQLLAARIRSEKQCSNSSDSSDEISPQSQQNVVINTSSHQPKIECHIKDTKEIMKHLRSPEVLFGEGSGEETQNNCPVCLEPLLGGQNQSLLQSSVMISPRGNENGGHPVIQKMKPEKLRGGENDFGLTILCCHTFHQMCLRNYNDTICPLCRYRQSPNDSSACDECGATENIWVCLICGFIGCFNVQAFQNNNQGSAGQENNGDDFIVLQGQGHSMDHFLETKHTYAIEAYTQQVWDFCKQNYVHRLIQNQLDGKLIEFGDPSDSNATPIHQREEDLVDTPSPHQDQVPQTSNQIINTSSTTFQMHQHGSSGLSNPPPLSTKTLDGDDHFTIDSVHRYNKKLESLNYEYNRMLAQTLDNQRAYFEQRLQEVNQEESKIIERKKHEIEDLETRQLPQLDEQITLQLNLLEQARTSFQDLEQTYRQTMTERLNLELDRKRLNLESEKLRGLVDSEISNLKSQIEEADQSIVEIKQDRADLMQHVQMSHKIKKSKNAKEIAEGQTLIFETSNNGKKGSKKK